MTLPEDEQLVLDLREMSRISSVVALFCDRTEHNEPSDRASVILAAKRLRELAIYIAERSEVDLLPLYSDRMERVEELSACEPLSPAPSQMVRTAESWRDLQVAQLQHDRHFHADVFGMPKHQQLIHIALHLSKLAGSLAGLFDSSADVFDDFMRRRLPDMLLFSIKLSTLMGEQLSGVLNSKIQPLELAG